MGQRASCSGGGFLVVFCRGKWILQFSYTVLNKQNCKFPYGKATWDSVPDGPVAASCLWTRTFALIERQSLQKNTDTQNHKIPYTTATWSTVEDAAFSANRNDKRILSFYFKIKNMQNHEILYTTATWGSVEDALEPARKFGVSRESPY